jgi:hypothetical protein
MDNDGCNNKTMTRLAMHTNIPQIKIKRKIKIGAFKNEHIK